MNVNEILASKSSNVITVKPDQSLHEASQLLAEHNIGALVVVDTARTPIGILSERDIVREMAKHGEGTSKRKVQDVMTSDVIIALPEDDLSYLSNTMTEKRIRHLPVIDDQKLVGIVSIGDIVKAQLVYFEGEAHTLRLYISGGYA
jgi:CBS domain-containing protein